MSSHDAIPWTCPRTGLALVLSSERVVAACNQAIARRSLRNAAGGLIVLPLSGGLETVDGVYLYPIRESIPCLGRVDAILLRAILTQL